MEKEREEDKKEKEERNGDQEGTADIKITIKPKKSRCQIKEQSKY